DETLIGGPREKIGHFVLTRLLGKGGFGQVYEAEDLELKRKVAIKIPWSHKVDQGASSGALKEARAAAVIQHPNVVKVHEVGALDRGLYIVSELVDGIDLGRWLETTSPDEIETARLMAEICDGVQAAHTAGVIHRDLKPGNILITRQGRPMVTDFGLARRRITGQTTVTRTGEVFGTLKYMSPEQARGMPRLIDERSDVFSLGIILYRMLTGRVPFRGGNDDMVTILFQITSTEPTSPRDHRPGIPKDIATICLRCLEKDPGRRYQTAAELAADLRRFADGAPVIARPISPPERLWRKVKRSPVAASAILLATMATISALWLALQPEPDAKVVDREIVVAPEDVRHRTTVGVRRADGKAVSSCRWCVVPLDRYRREPVAELALEFSDLTPISPELLPGDYLVVVEIPGYGFHEVYRRVPRDPQTVGMPGINSRNWTRVGDGYVWPEIVVASFDDITQSLVAIDGGRYQPAGPENAAPEFDIAPFYVAGFEFTAQQQRILEGGDPSVVDRLPAQVSAVYADQIAETFGCRLPLELEFEYLATNFGTTEVPSGRPEEYDFASRQIGDAMAESFDRMVNQPVYNLHWNAPEWTCGGGIPVTRPRPQEPDQFLESNQFAERRAVRGGPLETGRPDTVFDRAVQLETERTKGISFRLAIGRQPRFLSKLEAGQ
ncbi:MAG: serine/threonine protein kinase, partial [Planctomycetaceae bacterium]|nr:serine/threonine protein kinase [Planctomycetaceae bacterium]